MSLKKAIEDVRYLQPMINSFLTRKVFNLATSMPNLVDWIDKVAITHN